MGSCKMDKYDHARVEKLSNLEESRISKKHGEARIIYLFKKASELCTLCAAETDVIVFSPARKSYSFGHPSVDTIVDRYLSGGNYASQNVGGVHPNGRARVRDLNRQYTEALNKLEAEKKRGMELKKVRRDNRNQHWWKKPIEELGLQELELLKDAMDELKDNVADGANKLLIKDSHFMPTADPIGTSSSSQHGYPSEPNPNHLLASVVPNCNAPYPKYKGHYHQSTTRLKSGRVSPVNWTFRHLIDTVHIKFYVVEANLNKDMH
ncbi:Transcription factor [Macleaya cordata]|uniref:Transcription factor n=1 Tax=Macleaya cordata TaxID=56857 RepID=A0A200QXX7_MACCD|nr:Transcription factor [Macleaya cordata]